MILRKPYAFLIKHFRLIHLVLSLLLGYILYKTNDTLSFFSEYLSTKTYERFDGLDNIYLPPYLYFIIACAMFISIVIFILLQKKDKPLKYYVFLPIFYTVLSFAFIFVRGQFQSIAYNQINLLQLRITRDGLYLFFLAQVPFLIMAVFRATGFNIRKFNFQKDWMELNIASSDNEEVELDLDFDSNDVHTKFRRRLRIMAYVFKENTALILATIGILLITVGGILYNVKYVKNKIYTENEVFNYNGVKMKVLSSYQLNNDIFGTDISSNNFTYTVVRINAVNTTSKEQVIDMDNFKIKIGSRISYSPTHNYNIPFIALGKAYTKLTLEPNSEKIFIVIFKIDNKYVDHFKQLEFIKSYKDVKGIRTYDLFKIDLDTRKIDKFTDVKQAKLNETLDFEGSILKKTNITITKFDIDDSFTYQYQQCINSCYDFVDYIIPKTYVTQNMIVMRLKLDINIDKDIYNEDLAKYLIPSIGHIRYEIDGKEYEQNVPAVNIELNYKTEYLYYEVNSELKKADNIYLDFRIVDKNYTYVLKETA